LGHLKQQFTSLLLLFTLVQVPYMLLQDLSTSLKKQLTCLRVYLGSFLLPFSSVKVQLISLQSHFDPLL
jgi:hypothetical protein